MLPRLAKYSRLILISLVIVLALIAAVGLGLFDRFAVEGSVDRSLAIPALIAYWFLFFVIMWVATRALRYPRQFLLCIVSIAFVLGIAEFGCRRLIPRTTGLAFAGFRSSDFHHVYPPNTRMHVLRVGQSTYIDTNEDGLRTRYTHEEFKTYEKRVIALGDSFTLGLGVGSEETFPERLEELLRQAEGEENVAVLNAGVASYSPLLAKVLLQKKLAKYQPTLVILLLDATDIGDDSRYTDEARHDNGTVTFEVGNTPLPKYRGALFELLRPHLPYLRFLSYPLHVSKTLTGLDETPEDETHAPYHYYDFKVQIGSTMESNRFFIYRHPLDHTREYFDKTMRYVDEVARLSEELGAQFAFFVSPRYHHWNPEECPHNWEKSSYALDEPYQYEYFRYFEEQAPHREYPIINLLPDFQATDKFPLVFRYDPHWNAAGHAFAAETVMKHLVQRGLVGSESR